MYKQPRILSAVLMLLLGAVLTGCATKQVSAPAIYDLGLPASAVSVQKRLPAMTVLEVAAPPTLEGNEVWYRLGYAQAHQLKPYTLARWSAPPAKMFEVRVKQRLANLMPVLIPGDSALAPVLRIELDEFSQVFTSPEQSNTVVNVRVAVLQNRQVIGERSFNAQLPAGNDATSGARALASASDQLIEQMAGWLQTLDFKQQAGPSAR